MPQHHTLQPGYPLPLGATPDSEGTNFSLFSENATKVELCLFDASGKNETARIELPELTNNIWHIYVEGVAPGALYGYRVHGPYEPLAGHRFNHNKLLLDPYATQYRGDLKWGAEIFGYTMESMDDTTFDTRDSAPFMPKCVVAQHPPEATTPKRTPRVRWDETVVYEAHVKGLTQLHRSLPTELRGTYKGLAEQPVIDYIRTLGVTSVELLPVHAFVTDHHLQEIGLTNFWGYNSIGFFSPDARYAADKNAVVAEFRAMVDRLHGAGLEVLLDVVYNHTAEGNERGPTLSFKGIDNRTYYRLQPDAPRYYVNDTGTGNTVNVNHPNVLQLVCDSLRYWTEYMGVDGYRFDLGTVLARTKEGFSRRSGFLSVATQDPVLSTTKLIAEPWDIGPGGYQVGEFPPGWAEWNDTFRDTSRAFWRGESTAKDFAEKLIGSPSAFAAAGRRPWSSINLITAHDGFTLRDLVSYNEKHNEANKEDNKDGHDNNLSWNCGVEGPTGDAAINALRDRQSRNLLATLMLSQGTPMILAGDECGRTQSGNNNAYCQDSEIGWFDWSLVEKNERLLQFTQSLLELRRRFPVLRRNVRLTGEWNKQAHTRDLTWINAKGNVMPNEAWNDPGMRCFGMLLDGRAEKPGFPQNGEAATLLIVVNDQKETVKFVMPEAGTGDRWTLLLDTNLTEASNLPSVTTGQSYAVTARSLLLLQLQIDEEGAASRLAERKAASGRRKSGVKKAAETRKTKS